MRSNTWFGFACVVLLLAAPAAVSATDFSIFVSYYDTDDYNEAVGFGGRVAFFDNVQLEIGASYYEEFGRDIEIDLAGRTIIGFDESLLDLEVIPIEIGVRFNFATLYAGAGGTYYSLDTKTGPGVDDEFGLYARLGAQFGRFFAEIGYRDIDGTINDLQPHSINVIEVEAGFAEFDLTGYYVNVGWRF